MKIKITLFKTIVFSTLFSLSTSPLYSASESLLFGRETPLYIIINNRVLAKVNGKAISVLDLMKKMDMQFYRQFPEYVDSVQARHQYYQSSWRHALQELVNKELILSDATESKLPVSNGDIRQELESLFGPNIIENLDKFGMTYEEAFEIIRGEIILRRMIFYRVNNKAIHQVTPQAVKNAYDLQAKENMRLDQWIYNVISIRSQDPEQAAKTAEFVYELLSEKQIPVSELTQTIEESPLFNKEITINISTDNSQAEKEMSASYKETLLKLKNGESSYPIKQKSRTDNSTVFRIFYLKEMIPGGVPPFSELENSIKDKLLDEAIGKETELYLKRLREHFDVQNSFIKNFTDDDYQPFTLK